MTISRFSGKVAVITGAGSGIGRGIAFRFAREEAETAIVDIQQEGLDATEKEIRALNRQTLPIRSDATKAEDVRKAVEVILAKFGKIDILVNDVGLFVLRPLLETKESDWDAAVAINAKSTFLWSSMVAPHMLKQKSGCIINIGSDASKVGDPYGGAYNPAKHAVLGITKNLAFELAPYVRVNAVCPGYVDTRMLANFLKHLSASKNKPFDEVRQEVVGSIPLKRMATPDDIAGVVTFLASDDASYMTGQALNVTGGLLML